MFKYLLAIVFSVYLCSGTVIRVPSNDEFALEKDFLSDLNDQESVWQSHLMDFMNLVDVEKVVSTAVRFIDDPEVMKFLGFIMSPKFKDIVWQIESMEEFKELYTFLASRGYEIETLINALNSYLNLPHFDKPQRAVRSASDTNGVSGFIAAMVGTLPIDEMKALFKNKLQNNPEVKELYDTIVSPEFRNIIRKMVTNPKFVEIKGVLGSYGVDFKFICEIAKEVFAEDYQGIVCEIPNEVYIPII